MGQRHPGLVRERDELLHDVDAALVGQVAEVLAGAAQVGLLPPAHAPGEQPLRQRAPDDGAHAVPLRDGEDVALDAPVGQQPH